MLSCYCRYPPASWGHSAHAAKAGVPQSEIFCLKQQLAEAKAVNGRLGNIIKEQQTTIDHLQVGSNPVHAITQILYEDGGVCKVPCEVSTLHVWHECGTTSDFLQGHNKAWEAKFRDANSLKPATGGVSAPAGTAGIKVLSSTPLQGTPQRTPSNIPPVQSSGGPSCASCCVITDCRAPGIILNTFWGYRQEGRERAAESLTRSPSEEPGGITD